MFARSCRDVNHTLYAYKHSLQLKPFYVLHTAQRLSGAYLIQQAELGVLLLWVFAARVRVLLHQENISLFTLEKKNTRAHRVGAGGCSKPTAGRDSFKEGSLLRAKSLPLTASAFKAALYTEYYHRLHYIVGPSELSRSLTSCHALPVLVNEWYDILQGDWNNKTRKYSDHLGHVIEMSLLSCSNVHKAYSARRSLHC